MRADVNADLTNYRALRFLSRIAYGEESLNLKEIRDASAASLSGGYQRFSPYAAAYGNALLWILYDPVRITIVADGAALRDYITEINAVYIPETVVSVLSLSKDAELIRELKYDLHEAAVYLCAGKRCSKPIRGPERMKTELRAFAGKSGRP